MDRTQTDTYKTYQQRISKNKKLLLTLNIEYFQRLHIYYKKLCSLGRFEPIVRLFFYEFHILTIPHLYEK